MNPLSVKPHAWDDIHIIFTHPHYSVIFGAYEGTYCLGMRWNGRAGERGYPGQGKHPLWFVIPDPFRPGILATLITMTGPGGSLDEEALHLANDYFANE